MVTELDIDKAFDDYIDKYYADVKPVKIKKQTFEGKNSFKEILTEYILDKAEKVGYYK